jgi:3-dehydrosphinganine reductase
VNQKGFNDRAIEQQLTFAGHIQAAAKNPSTQRFRYFSADVSRHSYAGPLIAEATAWNNGRSPDIVWCMAGMSTPDLFLNLDVEDMRHQMDINYWGTAEMSHAILKEWLAQDAQVEKEPKHLIMTSSTIVFFSVVGYTPYAPTKGALRMLADTLSHEIQLYPQNVKIHIVMPGNVLSPGFERESQTKPQVTKQIEEVDPRQTPDDAARCAIEGLEKGQYIVVLNMLGILMRWAGLGASLRNNWLVDAIMSAITVSIVVPIFQMDILGKTRAYGKKHGHPATWKKQA